MTKKRDDEKLHWLLVGILLTAVIIWMDIWYSSFNLMHWLLIGLVSVLHLLLAAFWVIIMSKFNDPNYDGYRKGLCVICALLILIVGIHHATSVEDNQVIIDSKENAAKP